MSWGQPYIVVTMLQQQPGQDNMFTEPIFKLLNIAIGELEQYVTGRKIIFDFALIFKYFSFNPRAIKQRPDKNYEEKKSRAALEADTSDHQSSTNHELKPGTGQIGKSKKPGETAQDSSQHCLYSPKCYVAVQ
jgi:hypothetical protein